MDIQFTRDISEAQIHAPQRAYKRRWDRWLYLSILVILLASFLRWLIYPYFFDLSRGILLQQQHDVNFAEDIRIQGYYVQEGDTVHPGDTLFVYEPQNRTHAFYLDSLSILLGQNNDQMNLIALNAQIEKRRQMISVHRKRLSFWQSEKERKQKLIYLNIITPNELANVDRSIDDVAKEIALLDVEYRVMLNQRSQMLATARSRGDLENLDMRFRAAKSYFISPVEGMIDRLRMPLYEVTYKTDIVTSILRPDYFVRAFIDINKLGDFAMGDLVSVILPYKHKPLQGEVSRIYMVSEIKDPNLFDRTDRAKDKLGIVMEIVPVLASKQEWVGLGISSIPVKVRKFRFPFLSL